MRFFCPYMVPEETAIGIDREKTAAESGSGCGVLSDGPAHKHESDSALKSRSGAGAKHLVFVDLSDEQYAAVEGWRAARGIGSQPEALGELVRIGLLTEIAKIFRFVTDSRTGLGVKTRGAQKVRGRTSRTDI